MKRLICLLVILLSILGFCSCEANKKDASQDSIEIIPIESLLEDNENAARAQLNIGKYTKIFGCISDIFADYCTVSLINPRYTYLDVYMPVEVLAEFEKGQFVAIIAKVKSADDSVYTFEANKTEELTMFDEYLHEEMKNATTVKGKSMTSIYRTYYDILNETYNISMVYDYIEERSGLSFFWGDERHSQCDLFYILDEEKMREFLIGKWMYSLAYKDGKPEFYCTFNEDGSCVREYAEKKYVSYYGSVLDGYRYDDGGCYYYKDVVETDEWEIRKGSMNCFIGEPILEGRVTTGEHYDAAVFVLSEDAFVCNRTLFMRVDTDTIE